MIVEWKLRCKSRKNSQKLSGIQEREKEGSCSSGLVIRGLSKEFQERDMKELRRSKGKEILNTDQSRKILGSQNNGQADFNKRGSNGFF